MEAIAPEDALGPFPQMEMPLLVLVPSLQIVAPKVGLDSSAVVVFLDDWALACHIPNLFPLALLLVILVEELEADLLEALNC